jgi:hypothetical protein
MGQPGKSEQHRAGDGGQHEVRFPVDGVRGPLPRRPSRNEARALLTIRAARPSLWPVSGLTTFDPAFPRVTRSGTLAS